MQWYECRCYNTPMIYIALIEIAVQHDRSHSYTHSDTAGSNIPCKALTTLQSGTICAYMWTFLKKPATAGVSCYTQNYCCRWFRIRADTWVRYPCERAALPTPHPLHSPYDLCSLYTLTINTITNQKLWGPVTQTSNNKDMRSQADPTSTELPTDSLHNKQIMGFTKLIFTEGQS